VSGKADADAILDEAHRQWIAMLRLRGSLHGAVFIIQIDAWDIMRAHGSRGFWDATSHRFEPRTLYGIPVRITIDDAEDAPRVKLLDEPRPIYAAPLHFIPARREGKTQEVLRQQRELRAALEAMVKAGAHNQSNFTVVGGREFWDAGTWDTFVWDAPVQEIIERFGEESEQPPEGR
jgi:hypothetical protein